MWQISSALSTVRLNMLQGISTSTTLLCIGGFKKMLNLALKHPEDDDGTEFCLWTVDTWISLSRMLCDLFVHAERLFKRLILLTPLLMPIHS